MADHEDDHDDTHGDAHDDTHGHDDVHGETHGHDVEGLDRITSPMQGYSMKQVGIGFAILFVGLLVTFGLPLLAA